MKGHFGKKIAMLAMALILAVGLVPAGVDAQASTLKKSDIKPICKEVNMFVAVSRQWEPKSGTTKVKMSAANKLKVVSYYMSGSQIGFDFSDWAADGGGFALKTKRLKDNYRNLFGESVNINKIKINSSWMQKQDGKVYILSGDWGSSVPAYTIQSVKKNSKNTYTVKIKNQWKDESGRKKTDGWTKIKLKKSSKSKYGYVVTGITYR